MEKDYSTYSIEDFLADEDFLNWVFEPNQELNDLWKTWRSKHQDKEIIVKKAKAIAMLIREGCELYTMSDAENDKVWKGIQELAFRQDQK